MNYMRQAKPWTFRALFFVTGAMLIYHFGSMNSTSWLDIVWVVWGALVLQAGFFVDALSETPAASMPENRPHVYDGSCWCGECGEEPEAERTTAAVTVASPLNGYTAASLLNGCPPIPICAALHEALHEACPSDPKLAKKKKYRGPAANRLLPYYAGRNHAWGPYMTNRKWKTKKRREAKELHKAAETFLMGSAQSPVNFMPLYESIKELRHQLSVSMWGR